MFNYKLYKVYFKKRKIIDQHTNDTRTANTARVTQEI